MPRADSSVKCTRTDQNEAISKLKRLLVDNADITDIYAVYGPVPKFISLGQSDQSMDKVS